MDSFMCVCLLGLLSLGYATPVPSEIPPEDDVAREVEKDGFVMALTTQLPSTETTTPYTTTIGDRAAVGDNSTVAEGGETSEVKGEETIIAGEIPEAKVKDILENVETLPIEGGESAIATAVAESEDKDKEAELLVMLTLPEESSGEGEGPTTAVNTFTSPNEGLPMFNPPEGSTMGEEPLTTTVAEIISESIQGRMFHVGSEETEMSQTPQTPLMPLTPLTPQMPQTPQTPQMPQTPQTPQMPQTPQTPQTPQIPEGTKVAVSPLNPQPLENVTTMAKGHVTPDWVIILGFLVGVAVLVLLCVAIATRDKWNGPNQFNRTGVTLDPVDLQRAVEMETFLHNEQPKENGKAEEYSVIPLEELPHSYTS